MENREFLGTIYRTLKNKWIFGDFPNFRFGGKYAVKATTVRGSRQNIIGGGRTWLPRPTRVSEAYGLVVPLPSTTVM